MTTHTFLSWFGPLIAGVIGGLVGWVLGYLHGWCHGPDDRRPTEWKPRHNDDDNEITEREGDETTVEKRDQL